jgi:hypothetical protein
MSGLSREQMEQLMALADRELEGDERARAERLVGSNADAREVFEEMRSGRLVPWLAELHDDGEERAAKGPSLADSVMAQVSELAPRAAQVSSLDDARARRTSRIVAVAFATVALAAGVTLVLQSGGGGGGPGPVASVPSTVASLGASALASMTSVEVTDIDVPSHGVSVFEIPVAGAAPSKTASSVVVWIEDEPEKP